MKSYGQNGISFVDQPAAVFAYPKDLGATRLSEVGVSPRNATSPSRRPRPRLVPHKKWMVTKIDRHNRSIGVRGGVPDGRRERLLIDMHMRHA